MSMIWGNPTWFPLLGGTMQFIMPISRDDKEVLVHTLAWIKQTGDWPNGRDPTFEVVFSLHPLLAVVHPIHIVPCEVGPHFSIYHVYAPKDPKNV